MDDEVWNELLQSPYDPGPKPTGSSSHISFSLVVGVAVAMLAGGLAGWLLASGSDDGAALGTTTTQPPTTTTEPPIQTEPGFLPGYVSLGDTAFAPIVQFTSGDRTYIAVSEIVGSETDRLTTAPTVVGRYAIPVGDDTANSRREVTAVAAPGIRLIEFDGVSGDVALAMDIGTDPVTETNCAECNPFLPDDDDVLLEFTGFPLVIDDPSLAIDLGGGRFIQFDRIVLDDEWGLVDWHAESTDGLMAQVDVYVFFLDTETEQSDGGISGPASLLPTSLLGPRFGQSQPPARPGMAYDGSIQLSRTGPHITSENQPTGVAIRWNVTWVIPTEESASLEPAVLVVDDD